MRNKLNVEDEHNIKRNKNRFLINIEYIMKFHDKIRNEFKIFIV